MKKHFLAALAALTLAAPIAAQAQVDPSYGYGDQASYATSEEDVHGRIVSFDGAYSLQVRDERGFIDNIQLEDGTVINPTGLTLEPGMIVNVLGYDQGDYLAAAEIDTPYTFVDGEPCFDGHVWSYYEPTISLGFFFGNPGWWHGSYFEGDYAWNGGVRVYNNVTYRTVYRVVNRRPVERRNPIPVDRPPVERRNPIPVDRPPAYRRPVATPDRAPVTRYAEPSRSFRNAQSETRYAQPAARYAQPSTRYAQPAARYAPPAQSDRGRQAPAPSRESRPSGDGHERH